MTIFIGLILGSWLLTLDGTLCHTCLMVLVSIIGAYCGYTGRRLVGLDGEMWLLSIILMRSTVCLISTLNLHDNIRLYIFLLYVLSVLFFSCRCWIIIYALLELRLMPLLIVIIGRGIQCERIQARVYLLVYTIFLSIPIIICVVYIATIGSHVKYVTSIWITNRLRVWILPVYVIGKTMISI